MLTTGWDVISEDCANCIGGTHATPASPQVVYLTNCVVVQLRWCMTADSLRPLTCVYCLQLLQVRLCIGCQRDDNDSANIVLRNLRTSSDMAQCEMAPLLLTVFLASMLSFTFVSTMSDKQRDKLDEIEKLLFRLQNEIERMRETDNARHNTQTPSVRNSTDDDNNGNRTEATFETTNDNRTNDDIGNLTKQHTTQTESETTVSDWTTKVFDSTTVVSDLSNSSSNRAGLDLTTGLIPTTHPDGFHSTGPSRPEVTEGIQQTTTEAEKKDNEGEDEREMVENELREVEHVRRLIDEGEGLERQLKDVFSELRSLSQCTPVGEKCGFSAASRCCKGLKCNSTWSGTCHLDCIPKGKSCSGNFFCCYGSQCVNPLQRDEDDAYVCQ